MDTIKSPKKLIEVALPLDDINSACAYEKMPGIGAHPRGIHLWWARRPLAAARAVLFAQLVNDPGYQRELGFGVNKKEAEIRREKLFQIIRDLVKWENTNNHELLERAQLAVRESWRETCHLNRNHPRAAELFDPENLPAFHDPFAGGGAIPLEAQKLGLNSHASDLNPVPVMINKSMIEIPPKFAGRHPVGPVPRGENQGNLTEDWSGLRGLAEDVRRYGHWMQEEASQRIGHLYPKAKISSEMVDKRPELKAYEGQELTVITWLWARTVKCPNPACGCQMPLISSFVLSSKKGKEAFLLPEYTNGRLSFEVSNTFDDRLGSPKKGFKRGMSGIFECINCGSVTTRNYTAEQASTVGLDSVQIAVVCEGRNGRVYLSPTSSLLPKNIPSPNKTGLEIDLSPNPRDVWCRNFGLNTPADLFTDRQLLALTTFSDLIQEAQIRAVEDAKSAGMLDDDLPLAQGGKGARAYGEAIAIYLTFCVDRTADFNNSLTGWRQGNEKIMYLFSRQAIPMVWDFGEANVLENVVGGFITNLEYQVKCLLKLYGLGEGYADQLDAANQKVSKDKIISTDPPYYDNIGYADLSDFFYVWMRRSLRTIYPSLFATMAVPKSEELVATSYRHDTKDNAEKFFLDGMTSAMQNMARLGHPAFPVTIYYAFKQSETKNKKTSNTGWETFLAAVIEAGFSICGTWPMRSEQSVRMIGMGTNALASSVVLVCKRRPQSAGSISRRDFQRKLRIEMPEALETMIGGESGQSPIAPVDLAQAAIGPGMALYSKYDAILNQDGSKMSVHDALVLINHSITDYLNPDSGAFDADTQFCSAWFDQYGWGAGPFGEAQVLATAKGITVDGVKFAGVVDSGGGKVRLLRWSEYDSSWDPTTDDRLPIWEACHQMIRCLNKQGESEAGKLLAKIPEKGEPIRQLAYHLYTLCERKKWADDARSYNELVSAWHNILTSSFESGHSGSQAELEL